MAGIDADMVRSLLAAAFPVRLHGPLADSVLTDEHVHVYAADSSSHEYDHVLVEACPDMALLHELGAALDDTAADIVGDSATVQVLRDPDREATPWDAHMRGYLLVLDRTDEAADAPDRGAVAPEGGAV